MTLFGSGQPRKDDLYDFVHVPCRARERFEKWPRFPILRSDTCWEEFSFAWNLRKKYAPRFFDISVTCSYPFCNWFLRKNKPRSGKRAPHIFVTQNGDWPCQRRNSEYRWFGCDGLICTNPDYFEKNKDLYLTSLIPNGVDPVRFHPGSPERSAFGLPDDVPIVLMVSALIPSKRVIEGIEATSRIPNAHFVIAGDGPMRDAVRERGRYHLGERFHLLQIDRRLMPGLYRSADLFLHMSLNESSANAYIEAMATAMPIVTHDRIVTRWTFGDSAILVDTTDLDQVAQAIQYGLDIKCTQRKSLRHLAETRFDWKIIAKDYTKFFELVLGKTPR